MVAWHSAKESRLTFRNGAAGPAGAGPASAATAPSTHVSTPAAAVDLDATDRDGQAPVHCTDLKGHHHVCTILYLSTARSWRLSTSLAACP